jgi:hypothetical protein
MLLGEIGLFSMGTGEAKPIIIFQVTEIKMRNELETNNSFSKGQQ